MKLLLTSFGLGEPSFSNYPFSELPPINMETFGPSFIPDYSIFLLFDRFVIDKNTYDRLKFVGCISYLQELSNVITELDNSGRLEIVDYNEIIKPSHEIINKQVDNDLINLNIWRDSLDQAHEKYQKFSSLVVKKLYSKPARERTLYEQLLIWSLHCDDSRRPELWDAPINIWERMLKFNEETYTRRILKPYLIYITSNLILSNKLNAAIHDWADIEPLYRKKIELTMNTEYNMNEEINKIRILFKILFPKFQIKSPNNFIDLLNDSRIEELRNLITDSVERNIQFDMKFANQTLREVLQIERKEKRMRSIIGMLSLPIGFIPWIGTPLLEFITEEAAGKIVESKLRERKGWFYLISDISEI